MAIKKRLFSGIFFIFEISTLLLIFFCYAQEHITLTAYYPSPKADYINLTAYRAKIGKAYSNSSIAVTDDNLIIEGKLGINKGNDTNIDANATLDVGGKVKTTSFRMLQPGGTTKYAALVANDTNGHGRWVNGTSSSASNCVVRTAANCTETSRVNCLANETLFGTGAYRCGSGNINAVYIIDQLGNNVTITSSNNTTGYGVKCYNSGDSCQAQVVCCQM